LDKIAVSISPGNYDLTMIFRVIMIIENVAINQTENIQ
jgi:hypothetical protein